MAASRDQRRHVYRNDWTCDHDTEPAHVSESVVSWCRETLARCRRPFGIDHFDFAVAVRDSRQVVASLSLIKLRPGALYGDRLESQIAALRDLRCESASEVVLVSASIFSWGDAAHAALPARI